LRYIRKDVVWRADASSLILGVNLAGEEDLASPKTFYFAVHTPIFP